MDEARMLRRLDELYAIGGGRGANRPAGSAEEDEAHRLAAGWLRDARLAVETDPDGNLLGHSRERNDVWVGSHLDSVPHGGKFDGALGVVAAIEAVEQVGRGTVVAFRGEEAGCIGSRARVGRGDLPGTYLELHIEQGPRLAQALAPLGIVSAIAGLARGELVVAGRAGHAGTMPMEGREDALCMAAELALRIRDVARSIDGAVATVGRIAVEPGAANVIPARVTLTVDARAPDRARFERLIDELGLEPTYRIEPVAMAPDLRTLLREATAEVTDRYLDDLTSGAGHDAGILAAAGVRSAMLFVRSLNGGVSHSPDELSSDEDVAVAVDVLAAALARLTAQAGSPSK